MATRFALRSSRLAPPGVQRVLRALPMLVVAGAAAAACSRPNSDVAPPTAEFIVATADSTFWVRSGTSGIHVRAVPMTLARYDGRFHEVYVADVDRSFENAIFTGERVYARDLARGDSTLIYDDTTVVGLAEHYARIHPDASPLDPDDDTPTNPAVAATGETDLLEVRGPYVLLEHRSRFDHAGGEQADTVETAVDLRTGHAASLAHLERDAAARDTSAVRALPRTWTRRGYTLLARGDSADGSVSLTLRDGASRSWPLFTVAPHPRIYWLDAPPIDDATRRALGRAFNDAAAYDESVKYVRFTPSPSARTSLARHASAHAMRAPVHAAVHVPLRRTRHARPHSATRAS